MIGTIKTRVSKRAQNFSFDTGLAVKMAQRIDAGRILMFHGVGTECHSSELLEKKIVFLKKHFKIISLGQLLKKIDSGETLRNQIVLTFDDGLKNNAVHAYPLLRQYNVPATFYVCPGLIESGEWLWNHEARERLRSLPAMEIVKLASTWGCGSELEEIVNWLKGLDILTRLNAERQIRDLTANFKPSEAQHNAFDMMSWDDLRSLDEKLITVGSHTTFHAIAQALTKVNLAGEVVKSRKFLEDKLDRSIRHFCYPNGDFDRDTINAVKQTYRSAVTTDPGLVQINDDRHLFKRIPSENPMKYFAWRLWRPTS